MKPTEVVLLLAGAMTLLGIASAVFVLLREVQRRRSTRRAVEQLDAARGVVASAGEERLDEVVKALAKYDAATVERTVEGFLRGDDPRLARSAALLFARLGMVDKYIERLRHAPNWSERTHVAQVLGAAALPASVPALVEALRDAYEDISVKGAAADALAAIKDPEVVPVLVKELVRVDEHATPRIAEALVSFGSLSTAALLALIEQNESAPARVWAARILGRIGDPAAVDVLAARLRDRHDLLRVAVAEALGAIGDSRALQGLVQATLRDPAPQVRAHAAFAVATIAGARAADVLVAALSDPDYATRLRALEAFENIRLEDTSALEQALGDTNVEVKRRAALALERVGYLDKVIAQIASDDRKVVKRAYSILLELGHAGLADSIAAHIHHEAMPVRASVARACGDLGSARVGPVLLGALDDRDWPVRAALCEAIGKLRAQGGAQAMAKMLADPEETVREAAAKALGAYTASEIEPYLPEVVIAYQGGTIPMRLEMASIAGRLTDPSMTKLLVQGANDPSDSVRLRAVTSLAGRADDVAVAPLISCLTDSSVDVRMAAATALGGATAPEAVEALLRALPGAQAEVRERIAQALAGMSREQLLHRVDELAESEVLDVRLGIAWTLGKRGDDAGVRVLARLVRDREPQVRASAAGALGKLPGAETIEALLGAVEDRDPKARAAVVNALGKTGVGSEKTCAALEQRLHDPDMFVRNRAAIALARTAGASAAPTICAPDIARLLDDAAFVVAQGIIGTDETVTQALTAIMDPARLVRIQQFVVREEPAVRKAFFANLKLEDPGGTDLGDVLQPAALVVQYEHLLRGSQDVKERRTAIEALARLRTDRSASILAEALTADPAEAIRLRSAQVLSGLLSDEVAQTALIQAIGDPSADVASAAVRALQGITDRRVASALFRRLGGGPPALNDVVEQALADFHKNDTVAFLDRAMGLERVQTLVAAMRVLERIGSPQSLPLLREILRSRDPMLRAAAVRAVGAIPLAEASTLAGKVLEDPHETVRLAALDAIAAEGAESSLVRMAATRVDPSVRVRSRLAELLERFQGAGLRVLETLVDDAAVSVRAEALGTLLAIGEPESLRRFVATWNRSQSETRHELRNLKRAEAITRKLASILTASGDAAAREAAVLGIHALAVRGFEPYIEPSLADPKANVRLAAVRALAATDAAEIRLQIAQLIHDPDSSVREAARQIAQRAG